MQEWIKEFLLGIFNLISPANKIWEAALSVVKLLLGVTPMDVGGGSIWNRLLSDLYPPFFLIGSSLLLIFLSIGFLKEISDFRKNITIELVVTFGIKLIIAEYLLVNAIPLVQMFIRMAAGLSYSITNTALTTSILPDDPQIGEMLSYLFFGLIYLIAALIASFTIFFALYKRYLNLYLLVLFCPVALSTMAGDRGITQAAVAWVKSFLAASFEIVVIALALAVSSWMIQGGLSIFYFLDGTLAGWLVQVLEGIMTMTITAATVKGAEGLLRRSFAL